MLYLPGLTIQHAPPNMAATFQLLASHLRAHNPNTTIPGRRSAYSIPDLLDHGHTLLVSLGKEAVDGVVDNTSVEVVADLDDLEVE